eukprot:1657759-Pleurochrysis_carterae.AAC.1
MHAACITDARRALALQPYHARQGKQTSLCALAPRWKAVDSTPPKLLLAPCVGALERHVAAAAV